MFLKAVWNEMYILEKQKLKMCKNTYWCWDNDKKKCKNSFVQLSVWPQGESLLFELNKLSLISTNSCFVDSDKQLNFYMKNKTCVSFQWLHQSVSHYGFRLSNFRTVLTIKIDKIRRHLVLLKKSFISVEEWAATKH